jgi:hypothetical protein
MFQKKLADLTLTDFDLAWCWASDLANNDIESVFPIAEKDTITGIDGALWVRFAGRLADGTPAPGIASAQCTPPDLLVPSFFIEGRWHRLIVPPAPKFVLDQKGPERFADALHRSLGQVFPLRLHSEVKVKSTGRVIEKIIEFQASPESGKKSS